MNKIEFLSDQDVVGFIDWLSKDLSTRKFNLNFSPSRFVPSGLKADVIGVENVLAKYCWSTYWIDTRSNTKVSSSDWESTKQSLSKLSEWLNHSVKSKNEKQTFDAAQAVLQWGGVNGASTFMRKLYESGELIKYLNTTRKLLAVNGAHSQRISDINNKNILKFDSGLTKIHALHENEGSPIYDTRVAAAISLLYCLYRENTHSSVKSILHFPCGNARGDQLRNPKDLGFKKSKAFYTEIAHHEWAQVQLRLGWIFWALLNKNLTLFSAEGSLAKRAHALAKRAHALEASLFMIGYDLRCFGVKRSGSGGSI